MTAEQWRVIAELPHLEVSSAGAIRLAASGAEIRPELNSNGYRRLDVRVDGQRIRKYVHTAVLEAFKGPRGDQQVCRHLNGDALDNRIENLAWGSFSENMYDRLQHGTHHQVNKTHCPSGHAYDAENVYRTPGRPSARYCRQCQAKHKAAYNARKSVAA